MDLESILAELKSERDRIGRAIASLLEGRGNGRVPVTSAKHKKRAGSTKVSGYWANMSLEQRSVEMRRRAKVRLKNWKKGK
jgi:hypothetical protein